MVASVRLGSLRFSDFLMLLFLNELLLTIANLLHRYLCITYT